MVSSDWHSAKPRRQGLWLGIIALHLAAAWAMAHSMMAPSIPHKPDPVEVRLIDPPRPKPPVQPPVEVKLAVMVPLPLVQPPAVNLAQAVVVTTTEAQPIMPAKPSPVAAPPVTVAAPAAGPKEIPASAVRYLAEPHLHIPRMSRKLGESGTVVLRILVDSRGELRGARLKKSSGFDRLDQQALIDIRTARFAPYLEKGQPIDWEADAGLQYEVR